MNALILPSFVVYFLTNTLSLLGTWVQKVGLGWLAWQITESTFWTSVVSLLLMAPVGLLGPFIAVFAEQWNSRYAMLATKIMMVGVSGVIVGRALYDGRVDLHEAIQAIGEGRLQDPLSDHSSTIA